MRGLAARTLAFDYFLPPEHWPKWLSDQAVEFAAIGEPWISWWTDDGVDVLLRECGRATVELLTTADIIDNYASRAPIELDRGAVQHLVHAIVPDGA